MRTTLKVWILITIIAGLVLSGCTTATPVITEVSTGTATLTPEIVLSATPSASSTEKLVIFAPASTSSIPVLLAASKLENVEVTLYTNHSQANTLFLRGDVSILVTGLSVGADMYQNGAPVQIINSFVSGLSYLLTYGKPVNNWAELKGQKIYIPFEGSPIEETTAFLIGQAGLEYKTDITPVYSPFDSSVQLLKEGKAGAVVLPEPFVTLVEGNPNVYISLSYFDEWNEATGTDLGYPQVGSFVNREWAQTHAAEIAEFNQALGEAIERVESYPSESVETVQSYFKLPAELLRKSLNRTRYHLVTGQEMVDSITFYYQSIGKPRDEKSSEFYYLVTQ